MFFWFMLMLLALLATAALAILFERFFILEPLLILQQTFYLLSYSSCTSLAGKTKVKSPIPFYVTFSSLVN